jgi:hypothetical protein
MFGYPGVSFVKGPKGIQVNTGFGRAVEKRSTITLRPKAIAHASIGLPNPGNFGPRCKPVSVRGFRVYPPDETKAVFVGDGQMACSARGVGVGTVFPVQSGAH